jgi:acyl-coenzyme A thioesterase PaaI-like protein
MSPTKAPDGPLLAHVLAGAHPARGDAPRRTCQAEHAAQRESRTSSFERSLGALSARHHAGCVFKCNSPVENLRFRFNEHGELQGEFHADERHQSYDAMMHGGLAAAIIDASMVQCLMGHGVVAYTAELNLRYRDSVRLHTPTRVETRITGEALGKLFYLESTICQKQKVCVTAKAKFFKVSQGG